MQVNTIKYKGYFGEVFIRFSGSPLDLRFGYGGSNFLNLDLHLQERTPLVPKPISTIGEESTELESE